MRNKYIRFIVIAYIAINILGVIVYVAMPKGSFVQAITGVDLKQTEVMNNPEVLAHKSSVEKYNVKNYNFNYDGKDLGFVFVNEHNQIFIDRKTSDDNKIELYWYSGSIIVNGIDFTNILKEPNMKLINNKLNIEYEKQNYNLTQFSKDVVINQFYEKKDNEMVSGLGSSGIIYIKIPKNLKILGDEEYQYLSTY